MAYASTIIPTAAYAAGGTPSQFMARLERHLPAWMAANMALPDYHTNRPTVAEAMAYCRKVLADSGDAVEPGELLIERVTANPEHGEALDVHFALSEGLDSDAMQSGYVMTVWYQASQHYEGGRYLYGEW